MHRLATPLALVSALALALAACGASIQPSPEASADAGADTTATDAPTASDAIASDAPASDGACIQPVEGAPCSATDQACAQPGNPCCIGYIWSCDATSHTWVKLGLGCACQPDDAGPSDAGAFACGADTCGGDQVCTATDPGVVPADGGVPSPWYACAAMPAACASNPTCDCVKANLGPSCQAYQCTVDASGHVSVRCMGV